MPSQERRDVADIHQRLDSITRQIEQISQPAPRGEPHAAQRRRAPMRASRPSPASSTTPFRASTRGCRRFRTRRRPGRPRCRTSSVRPRWSSAPQPRSIAPRRRSARPRWISRSPKSPRAQNELDSRRPRRCRRVARAPSGRPAHARCSARGSGFFLARAAPAQDHQPDRGAAASRSYRAVDRRVPQRTRRNPPRHHRGDAAPGDRIARERNPLAVAPHRREPPERQRRPGAGQHRTRARRNPRGAALADAGRATHRLRRGDPQSRRQARPDPALERRSVDRAAARKRDRGAARHRLQRRLQRRAGAALRRRAHAVGQGRSAFPLRAATAIRSRHARAAPCRADLDAGNPPSRRPQANIRNSSKTRCARCRSGSTASRSATTMRRPSPISNSACPICWSAWKPPAIARLRPRNLGRVEEGLHDILRSLERQHASLVALADNNRTPPAAQPMDPGIVDLVKRELSDIRFSQSETDRRTQDSLETVHSTLGHVVDRLSTIEGDLRTVRAAPPAARPPPAPFEAREEMPRPMPPRFGRRLCAAGRRSRNRNCRIPPRCKRSPRSISPPRRANSTPREPARRRPPRQCRRAPSAKSWSRMPRAARGDRAGICRRIIRSSRAPGRPRAWRLAVGADRGVRKRDQRNRRRSEGAGEFVELHCRRAPRRAGRCRRAATEKAAAPRRRAQGTRLPATRPRARRQGSRRTSPPRSARCWSARAWS